MNITFIGTGDAFGSGGRMNTCFYVETPVVNFLVDCGAGTLSGLKKHQIVPEHIDAILISHFHGDHYGGVPYFLLDAAIGQRKKELTIISPPGGKEKLTQLLTLLYPGTEVLEKLDLYFVEYQPFEEVIIGKLYLHAFPVIHNEASLPHGLRIKVADQILSYSGDTEWTDNLIQLCEDADLFICECNFFNLKVKGHFNYTELLEKRDELNCKRIMLTHFGTEMLNNLEHVSLDCAFDGLKLEI